MEFIFCTSARRWKRLKVQKQSLFFASGKDPKGKKKGPLFPLKPLAKTGPTCLLGTGDICLWVLRVWPGPGHAVCSTNKPSSHTLPSKAAHSLCNPEIAGRV